MYVPTFWLAIISYVNVKNTATANIGFVQVGQTD